MNTPRTDKAEPQGFLIGQSDYVRMRELSRQLERELTAETGKVKELEKENAQLRRLIEKGRESTATELGLAAQVEMYRNGAADLMEKVKRLREALENILPKVAHEYQCGTVRPAMHWAEHGSMSFDNCQCEIKSASATLEATKP